MLNNETRTGLGLCVTLPVVWSKGDASVWVSLDGVSTRAVSDESHAPIQWLNCIRCDHKIALMSDRLEVSDKHEHTFINPAGVIYRVGCFTMAPGAVEVGDASGEFAWFRGHLWRCLCCRGCELHLGWSFISSASKFCGLILDQLCEAGAM